MINKNLPKSEQAVETFQRGFNCAQSVLSTYSEGLGLEPKLAMRIATAFGGGIARLGETCGAVSGAIMLIGLKYGMDAEGDLPARDKTFALAHEFIQQFINRHGTILCRELLGCEISTLEGYLSAKEAGKFDFCPVLVRDACQIIEEIL